VEYGHQRHNRLTNAQRGNRGLSVMKSVLHGLGCFATVHFPKASALASYAGERITHTEAINRMTGANGRHICQLDLDHYIDGSIGGNETRYLNHSCEPNAGVSISDGFMIIFALREIFPGEEVTVDYLNSFEQDQSVCRCRTPTCRKWKKKPPIE
jgi:uncharacterized protein